MTDPEVHVNVEGLKVHTQKAPETAIHSLKIDPPVIIICHSKLRRWATKNALTLLFLNIYFMITWGVIIFAPRYLW